VTQEVGTRHRVDGSERLLRRNCRSRPEATILSLKELATRAAEATSVATLLGIEGAAARLYFESFVITTRSELGLSDTTFDFSGCNRRPPRNVVNCLLSFGYALLTKDLTAINYPVGFNPYLGSYHRPRFGRPALALDLAEGLDHQPPDSRAREDHVRPFDLPVHVLGRPVEHEGKQLAEDLLSGTFGNATEAIALDEVSSTEVGEARSSCADAVIASLMQDQHLRHGGNVSLSTRTRGPHESARTTSLDRPWESL
jgi:hypothetical protein